MTTYPTTPEAPITRAAHERLRARLTEAHTIIIDLVREAENYNDWLRDDTERRILIDKAHKWLWTGPTP